MAEGNEEPKIVIVVAMARNGVIGRSGGLPWKLSSDLKRYRSLTMGKPMIMGRRTLQSIGRLLDGRDTIVLTRRPDSPVEGALRAATADEALALGRQRAAARGADEIVIAGGAEIYAQFLPRVERMYVTYVEAEPEGDTVFPPFRPDDWILREETLVPKGPKDSADSRFAVYDRRRGA